MREASETGQTLNEVKYSLSLEYLHHKRQFKHIIIRLTLVGGLSKPDFVRFKPLNPG